MQFALTSPVYRSVAVGGLLLALSLAYGRSHQAHRLRLHAVDEPSCVYVTAWRRGDVRIDVEPGKLTPLRFTTRAWLSDGCRWLGKERLDPIGPRTYAYRYDEVILGCEPDAEPYLKTPRTGTVTIED
jgi:hypothetical protein